MTVDGTPSSTMRRDILSAYLATGLKTLSWVIAAALVFRYDPRYFAVFALVRGTLSLLNYTTLGLAPAIIHRLAGAAKSSDVVSGTVPATPDGGTTPTLAYETPAALREEQQESARVVFSALILGVLIWVLGSVVTGLLARLEWTDDSWLQSSVERIVWGLGTGLALRLASDVCGAILQAFGRIAADNLCLAATDVAWVLFMVAWIALGDFNVVKAASSFQMSGLVLVVLRAVVMIGMLELPRPRLKFFSGKVVWSLLGFGTLVSVAQLADFLYAPTDYWLIKQLIGLETITTYAPAVQIDAALLLVVTALASVLLPKAAIAHAAGEAAKVRQYFMRGTLASVAMLVAAALATWLLSPWIFRLWLNHPMPATQAILPLVLIHTVVGGSSAVGRSILLGMGKVKPFTIAVLIAGVSNVILSYSFVRFGGLGLNGIVLGTICAVIGRCAIWQPWYVWRSLSSPETRDPKPETR